MIRKLVTEFFWGRVYWVEFIVQTYVEDDSGRKGKTSVHGSDGGGISA